MEEEKQQNAAEWSGLGFFFSLMSWTKVFATSITTFVTSL